MKPERLVIFYRDSLMDPEELVAAKKHFFCTNTRMEIRPGDLVFGRYVVLPNYKEQERDVSYAGARLVNSNRQHNYVADMRNWAEDLEGLTPKTWYRLEDVPEEEGPFVLKGKTNSRKFDWNTHMFAADKKAAADVYWRLSKDGLIGDSQDIYIRKFEPLVRYYDGLNGLPISKEFRFFIFQDHILSVGFYWSGYEEEIEGGSPDPSEVPVELLDEVKRRIRGKINFVVVDVAQKQDGSWMVVELNDAQMSGLSNNDPEVLYSQLRLVAEKVSEI